ncbi:multi-sensor hybrid histidine kinase [Tolypothrix tenuis PCC 7101]|uniref:Circadian input-output histidine kinase CikA n=1 Tax=Tolypothrix tenuis PCC 7101 TaxID=231146 RepID=A0A1Z4MT62_9CYAN|nr:response regulator [Aulosira sp. FACHB-113]BAY96657.1 multi-sensor hybrid histidine kinase [Tolypothrix tenuis PCC 7101]BAZ72836.1 multi-sensor hybrid histidine kinase [Aulosira laxa NIES-50]
MTRTNQTKFPSVLRARLRKTSKNYSLNAFGGRTLALKWHIVLLVAGALLPVVLFAVAVVQRLSFSERASSQRRLVIAARNLTQDLEREVSSTTRTLQALAASDKLDQGDLKAFYKEAQRTVQTQPTWLSVILLTPDKRQVLNTFRPFGTLLPLANEPESVQRVVETQQPTVGYLAFARAKRQWAFPVRVPVVRNGKLQYVLTAIISSESLTHTIKNQPRIDGEWTRTVVDGHGIVVARTLHPERFMGKPGTPSFLKRIAATSEGVYRETTLEGAQVYVAFKRANFSNWTTAVVVAVDVIESPARRAMWLVVGSGLALLLVSGVGALVLSQWISQGITEAATAAEALAKGEYTRISPSTIEEVALLGEALEFSANLLSQRERERDEHLKQVEAARAEAEAANRLKDEFLITVSHELRTPLNAIFGWAQLLRGGKLNQEKTQNAIATIERNAKAQAQLVNDLLDTSRIILGKLRLETQPLNLATVIISAIDSMRHAAEVKDIDLQVQLTNVEPVLGDQNRLQQVVWNLLANAVKFTPQGGWVEVQLQQVDSLVEVRVRDTGVGIKAEFLPYVFERFRQADGSTTREYGGLGLGLAIVRHLVELHGGTVQADSDGEGKGATFTMKLPVIARQESISTPPITSANGTYKNSDKLKNVRVLVVDDDPDARDLVSAILMQQGAEVCTCASAAQALNKVFDWKPAVILCDIGMPLEDGYDFIRKVRDWESDVDVHIPAIAVTAFAREEDKMKAIASGYQMHIPKPLEPTHLADVVASLVARN